MAKFKVPSWLNSQPGSAASSDGERKKQNRRSFSGFAQPKSKRPETATPQDATAEAGSERSAAMSTSSQMTMLSTVIATETEKLEKYLMRSGLAQPGFDVTAPGDFPKLPADMQQSRQTIINATQELSSLVRGPREHVRWSVWGVSEPITIMLGEALINRHSFWIR